MSEEALRAKVAAGMKGGPFYTQPMVPEAIKFVDGVPAEVKAATQAAKVVGIKTTNPHK